MYFILFLYLLICLQNYAHRNTVRNSITLKRMVETSQIIGRMDKRRINNLKYLSIRKKITFIDLFEQILIRFHDRYNITKFFIFFVR